MNLLSIGLGLLEKVIPDLNARSKAQAELLKLQATGELAAAENEYKLVLAQLNVNKTEAASASMFVAGWRPYIGWVCGTALGYQFLVHPLLCWLSAAQGWPVPPRLDMDTLLTLLTGMLGLAGLRTGEKFKGVAR